MKHIQQLTKRYIADSAEKTVTCAVSFKLNIEIKFGNSTLVSDTPMNDNRIKELMKSYKRVGGSKQNPVFLLVKTAVCKGSDKFDVVKGIDVARHKAEIKLNTISTKLCFMIEDDLKNALAVTSKDVGKNIRQSKRLINEIRQF